MSTSLGPTRWRHRCIRCGRKFFTLWRYSLHHCGAALSSPSATTTDEPTDSLPDPKGQGNAT